jgi:aldose 1-epimerase
MRISKEYFTKKGKEKGIFLFTLSNDKGTEIKITNYGAAVTSIKTVDNKGKSGDIVLGFDNLEQYESDHPFFGVICGRYANRIGNARFKIKSTTYKLTPNDGNNLLHGGSKGFDKVVWMAGTIENKKEVGVKLVYLSPDMEEGFPGNMLVEVVYLLNNSNELKINYSAKTDKSTVVNLTNHCYFNLNGCKKEIYDHSLTIHAKKITEPGKGNIPTGKIISVTGTPFDFQKPSRIGDKIKKVPGGYDHNFVINRDKKDACILAGKLTDPQSGRTMEVFTTEPGIQFYSANYLDGSIKGKGNIIYKKHFALCLETQHYPDSPNKPNFPNTFLNPGEEYTQTTIFKFGIKK